MGLTQRLGTIPLAIQTDSSNNVGIGGAANASYKLAVTGASLFSGAATFSSSVTASGNLNLQGAVTRNINFYDSSNTNINAQIQYDQLTSNTGQLFFGTNNAGTFATRMTITSSGNVGIGTSSPVGRLHIVGGSGNGNTLRLDSYDNAGDNWIGFYQNNGTRIGYMGYGYSASNIMEIFQEANEPLIISTNATERMRITSGGYTKISNTGSYEYVNASIHEVRNSAADYILYGTNPHASNPSGYYISYPSASPNNTSNYFIACADSSAARFRVASNGNCYNVTGTYTSGVSDIRYKEQIVDANSQWNDIKSLRVVNFKFIKDVEENGENALRQIGFIAQEVEEVSPNLVDEMYDEKTGESWKTIKASIIHLKAVKALQEAMARIEELEAKITALENK